MIPRLILFATAVTVLTPFKPKYTRPLVYTLGTGEAMECGMGWEDDCGWHLRQCGYKKVEKFDCIVVDDVSVERPSRSSPAPRL